MQMLRNALKSLARSRFITSLGTAYVTFYIYLMKVFLRAETPDLTILNEALAQGKGAICVFWHQRLTLVPLIAKFSPVPFHMLISLSRDGEVMAKGAKILGANFIRGSAANEKKAFKNKSGAPALLQMIAALENGEIVLMTPDGPRGPARKVRPGAIRLAARTGAPIIPIGFSASSGWHYKTWDKSFMANPFARKVILNGDRLAVAQDVDQAQIEATCLELEERLNGITELADKKVGKSR